MHRYNNMDHSMRTGILAAENVLGTRHNVWEVNEDPSYSEEIQKSPAMSQSDETALRTTFSKLDPLALAVAMGTVCGLALLVATLWLIVKGGPVVGPNLQLLSQYFFGYSVTFKGALVAFAYAFALGFCCGLLGAYLRNIALGIYIFRIRKELEWKSLKDFLDII